MSWQDITAWRAFSILVPSEHYCPVVQPVTRIGRFFCIGYASSRYLPIYRYVSVPVEH